MDCLLGDDTLELGLEPLDGLSTRHSVVLADLVATLLGVTDTVSLASEDNVEVHTVDTNRGIVLKAKIDVLVDSESKVAALGEVSAAELVLLHLESLLEDVEGLSATDGAVSGNLLVTTDTERTDGDLGLGGNGDLVSQLLEHLGGTGKTITGLASTNVEAQLLDLDLPHGVLGAGHLSLLGLSLKFTEQHSHKRNDRSARTA